MSGVQEADGDFAPNPMTDLTGFQRDMLSVLDGIGSVRGQVVMDRLQASGYEDVTHARVYPNLDQLADKGLIEKQVGVPDRRSNSYEITDLGQEAREKYHEWDQDE